MNIYNIGAVLFVIIAVLTLLNTVWYAAVPPLGAALGLYFWGRAKQFEALEDSDARR